MVGRLVATRLLPLVALIAGAVSLLLASGERSLESWSVPSVRADNCAVRPTASHPVLQLGSSGGQVAVLQSALTASGFSSGYLDGLFGWPEDAAVKSFQTSRDLPTTGVVDAQTWMALDPFIDPTDRVAASQPANGLITAALNAAGFNGLFPGHLYFGLPALETGPANARSLRQPYLPPTLLKAVGWIEASWRQADSGGAPVISFDCGYGITQITAPGAFPLGGIGMVQRSTDPDIYNGVQVPIATSYTHNIAFGAKTLIVKWNLAPEWRPVVGNSDPALLEDWYYALWSYNGFVSSNHPGNFSALRGDYSCNLSDGFNHNRTQFPYQELVLGCVKHPPAVDGVELWPSISVTLPATVPPYDGFGEGMNIPTPQPAHADPTPGTLPSPVAIDIPGSGVAAQPFVIAGWGVDYAAPSGTGIDAVHVYAYPSDASGAPTGAPVFLGAAAYGGSRPDVATTFGNPDFVPSGYGLTVRGLSPGFYRLVVYGRSTLTGTWYDAHRVVQVPRGDAMAVDVPAAQSSAVVPLPFTVAGWAIDRAAAGGTGVDAVHVYAYPSDASGAPTGAPQFLGVAVYGGSRPDVGAVYGEQFTDSSYGLSVSGLDRGFYRLMVYARSTVTGLWNDTPSVIEVPPPAMGLDAPLETAVQQPLRVVGWAVDRAAASGTGVDVVHVYVYPSDASGALTGAPQFLGAAAYGGYRPDVGGVFGLQFNNSAYELTVTGLASGYYQLAIFARSTVSGLWQGGHRLIWLPPPAMGLDVPSAGLVEQPFVVAGWAIGRAAASGTGVDVVHVYAYPSEASGAPTGEPVFLGAAVYGGSRPDVGAVYGGRFAESGYGLSVGGLAGGYYHLVVYARSTVTGLWNEAHRVIQVP